MVKVVEGIEAHSGQALRLTIEAERIIAAEYAPARVGLPWISAGLVDLQVNGYGGHDLNDGVLSVETVVKLCQRLASEGTTRFFPTIITAYESEILQRLGAIAEAVCQDALARAMIAGIHVEGPFFSPIDGPRGAHRLECIRTGDPAEIGRWQEAAGGLIRIITLAPEVAGAIEVIRAGVRMGIAMSLGHSAGLAEDFHAAADAGATMSTHLGNGIFATLPRHPNAIWAQLADDRLQAGLICDGHHMPADTVKSLLRAKGHERAFFVSDSVAVGGLPAGRYSAAIGGDVEVAANGRVSLADTVFLAGSGQCLREIAGRAPHLCDISLAQALDLSSARPAAILGLPPASLAVGARADIILFDWEKGCETLRLRQSLVAGQEVGP